MTYALNAAGGSESAALALDYFRRAEVLMQRSVGQIA